MKKSFTAAIATVALAAHSTVNAETQNMTNVSAEVAANVSVIRCQRGEGTAFRIGSNVVTVSHVWKARKCKVGGAANLKAISVNPATDFALLESPEESTTTLEISCEPLRKGETYNAIGYLSGKLTVIPAQITGQVITPEEFPDFGQIGYGTNVFVGQGGRQFTNGLSGGPVLNSKGQVVAIVIGYDENGKGSFARAVINTPLCS